ncbi:unnamed protein product [Symbiodinium sp. CCMP2592]|nr:unnamed protein product [Symbiodinium sp. CCMP2592]
MPDLPSFEHEVEPQAVARLPEEQEFASPPPPPKVPPMPPPPLPTQLGPLSWKGEFFALPAEDREGEPRPLTWEEALVDFLPIGATVRGVIQELRPYGSFIGLIVNGMAMGKFGEDSRIRGFCEDLRSSSDPAQLQVGEHVAVKIVDVDMLTKRVFVSTREADPPWPAPRERVLHTPEKYEDPSFFPLP